MSYENNQLVRDTEIEADTVASISNFVSAMQLKYSLLYFYHPPCKKLCH